ncbi:glycosyltransferase [Halovulum marinum]|nr:glycosyltransferase [Halovulum marinum]
MSGLRVAVVIPVFRHSALADEAIASALALGERVAVVAVDDGCPNAETRIALDGWQAAHPGRFHRLHQANRGLSGARNTGIDFALARYPQLEAVFPLDADNRLDPHAMDLFAHLLDGQPQADWFYPNFDMFGLNDGYHNGGPFSLARMAESNHCEAGSLIRRRLLDAGLRFDETMRGGYEDWEFWLSAAAAGFRGQPVAQAFFRYRKRPESMLAGSHDNDVVLRAEIRRRHRWLFDRDGVARHAAAEAPRYALIETGSPSRVALCTDPMQPRPGERDTLIGEFLAARARPGQVPRPVAWVLARPAALAALRAAGLAPAALWHLHAALADAEVAVIRLRRHPDGQRRITARPPAAPPAAQRARPLRKRERVVAEQAHRIARDRQFEALTEADLLMIRTATVAEFAFPNFKKESRAEQSVLKRIERARVAEVTVELETAPTVDGAAPPQALRGLIRGVRAADKRDGGYLQQLRPWRKDPAVTGPANMNWALRAHSMGGVPLPHDPAPGTHIGFVAPIFQFGGVEKCIVALADALKRQGVHCHLFVYGNVAMAGTGWLTAPFETVHQISDPKLRDWRGPQYLGTNLAATPSPALLRDMLGPLSGMDAVIATGCAALFHGLGALRSKGILNLSWEHLLETGGYGRAYGTPYLGVAYEGGLDLILTCSTRLADWMHAQGVPSAKLLPIPNGPGFPMPAPAVRAALQARRARPADAPLRVGFLGRLDAQKGADRYLEIARACAGLPIEFSLTGSAVIAAQSGLTIPDSVARYPAAFGIDELAEAFARLDVLLMPSRDEGLPLTIMEAQRVGVIPVATDVGAVAEAIRDGETGFLVENHGVVDQMTALLRRLLRDPDLRQRVSGQAAGPEGRWDLNASALMGALAPRLAARDTAESRQAAIGRSASAP